MKVWTDQRDPSIMSSISRIFEIFCTFGLKSKGGLDKVSRYCSVTRGGGLVTKILFLQRYISIFNPRLDAKEMIQMNKMFSKFNLILRLARALLNLSLAERAMTRSKVTHWGTDLFPHLHVFVSFEKIQMFFENFSFSVLTYPFY